MSALAMIVRPQECVLVAGDGVSTIPGSGAVGGYSSKLHFVPHLDLVLGVCGFGGLQEAITFHMPVGVRDFDGLIEIMPHFLPELWGAIEKAPLFTAWDSVIAVAGYSNKREQFEGWRYSTQEWSEMDGNSGEVVTKPAFAPRQIPDNSLWTTCSFTEEALRRFGLDIPHDDDTAADGVIRAICAARAESGYIENSPIRYNVGGFVQAAHITRGYAQTWIAHRWPEDVIGEPIDPSRGDPLPDYLMRTE